MSAVADVNDMMRALATERVRLADDLARNYVRQGQLATQLQKLMAQAKDLFKMVIMSLLDFGLGALLGSIFPPATALGGAKVGAVGPAQFNFKMSGLQPMTAYAVARDPAFQQVLREGVLVAQSQGFSIK